MARRRACGARAIVAPRATTDFVERFLTTVPATKLCCFGGDYMTVENVVGHAEIARRGLHRALESLVDLEWLGPARRTRPRATADERQRQGHIRSRSRAAYAD